MCRRRQTLGGFPTQKDLVQKGCAPNPLSGWLLGSTATVQAINNVVIQAWSSSSRCGEPHLFGASKVLLQLAYVRTSSLS
jgi:hypothetical protein